MPQKSSKISKLPKALYHYWETFWHKCSQKWSINQFNRLLRCLDRAKGHPNRLARLQTKITKYRKLNYFNLEGWKWLLRHGNRSENDIFVDMYEFGLYLLDYTDGDLFFDLAGFISYELDAPSDLLQALAFAIIKIQNLTIRQNIYVKFLLAIAEWHYWPCVNYKFFDPAHDDLLHFGLCTKEVLYCRLYSRIVVELETVAFNEKMRSWTGLEYLHHLSQDPLIAYLTRMWDKIVEEGWQYSTCTWRRPIDWFAYMFTFFSSHEVSEAIVIDFMEVQYQTQKPFEFLELLCLSPPVYDRLHHTFQWGEMEQAYKNLYQIHPQNEWPLLL